MIGKKEFIHVRYSLVLIAILIIIASSGSSLARTNVNRIDKIDMTKWLDVPIIEAKAGEVLNVEFQVTSGGEIDVLLMKPSDYEDYKAAINSRGPITYIAEGSVLKKTINKFNYTFKEGGDYHLVFDNTDVPKFGGSPIDQVEMNIKVLVSAPSQTSAPEPTGDKPYSVEATPTSAPKTSGFEGILAALAIMTLVLRRR